MKRWRRYPSQGGGGHTSFLALDTTTVLNSAVHVVLPTPCTTYMQCHYGVYTQQADKPGDSLDPLKGFPFREQICATVPWSDPDAHIAPPRLTCLWGSMCVDTSHAAPRLLSLTAPRPTPRRVFPEDDDSRTISPARYGVRHHFSRSKIGHVVAAVNVVSVLFTLSPRRVRD